MLGLCSAALLNPGFIYMLLFALPSAAETTPGDWHRYLQPVGQHERNTFPYQTENFPEQIGGQSTHSGAQQKKEKEGEPGCTQMPVEGNSDKAEATAYVAEKVHAEAICLAKVGCLSEQGQ